MEKIETEEFNLNDLILLKKILQETTFKGSDVLMIAELYSKIHNQIIRLNKN